MKTKRKPALTVEQQRLVRRLLRLPLTPGECRTVHICRDRGCNQIQAHDFVPYGLGRGVWRNMCLCNAVDRNWIFRAAEVGKRTARHLPNDQGDSQSPEN